MRVDFQLAIICALAAIPLGLAVMAAPLYWNIPRHYLGLFFWGGLGSTAALFGLAAVIAFKGDAPFVPSPYAHKVAMGGMVMCIIGLVCSATVFYWPSAETISESPQGALQSAPSASDIAREVALQIRGPETHHVKINMVIDGMGDHDLLAFHFTAVNIGTLDCSLIRFRYYGEGIEYAELMHLIPRSLPKNGGTLRLMGLPTPKRQMPPVLKVDLEYTCLIDSQTEVFHATYAFIVTTDVSPNTSIDPASLSESSGALALQTAPAIWLDVMTGEEGTVYFQVPEIDKVGLPIKTILTVGRWLLSYDSFLRTFDVGFSNPGKKPLRVRGYTKPQTNRMHLVIITWTPDSLGC